MAKKTKLEKVMKITKATFLDSSSSYKYCPINNKPEYAFIGRSNVGKSSLINAIVNKKRLAKTSAKPGKTQLINHFIINENWYLVDLPGYGYAVASKIKRKNFQKMIYDYLQNRSNLVCLFVLIDVRHSMQKIDKEFMSWIGNEKIPFSIIFTKSDKLSKSELEKNIKNYKKEMLLDWESLPTIFTTSAKKEDNTQGVLSFIEKLNNEFLITSA